MQRQHEFETRIGRVTPEYGEGYWVKVGFGGERFWCFVGRCSGSTLTVVVDNDLLLPDSPIRRGEVLRIHERHVLESVSVSEARAYQELMSALGDEDEAALRWRASRIESGAAAEPAVSPSGMLVLPSGKELAPSARRVSSARSRVRVAASIPPLSAGTP